MGGREAAVPAPVTENKEYLHTHAKSFTYRVVTKQRKPKTGKKKKKKLAIEFVQDDVPVCLFKLREKL